MTNFVRNFKKFQDKKRNESLVVENSKTEDTKSDEINESVIERDNKYIISGVSIPKSLVSTFASGVKTASGKDIFNDFSKTTVAEELVRYMIDQHSDGKEIPMSALYGGGDDMEKEIDDVSMEEKAVEVGEDGLSEDTEDTEDTEVSEFDKTEGEGEALGAIGDEDAISEEIPDDLLGDVDDGFQSLEDDEDEDADEEMENIDLPDGDPITSNDLEDDEDAEGSRKLRRRKRREENEEL
jgi:hypothetical protein